jgi:predicted TIM-barrel fold metal-dependent hydrolase
LETQRRQLSVIDCDVHNVVPSVNALLPYLPDYWQEYVTQSDLKGPGPGLYSPEVLTAAHPETKPEGGPAGSDLALLQRQALDPLGVDLAILNCAYAAESVHNPYGAAALAGAVNDWQRVEWLEREPRLRASLVVPSHEPELAAQEIERSGSQPGFVQVFLPVRSSALYGTRRYHPIYRAAAQHNLVIGIHFGGAPGAPPSSSGWPSYYIEEYADMSQIFQSQLISLIVEGVFEEFPTLRVVLAASGVTWLPSLMWRLDKEWKGLRREIPWVKRLPSEYIYDHVRFTLQPLDAPPNPRHLLQIIDQLGSEELLLFSTDYPYNCFDNLTEALPDALPADLKQKILVENARKFYGFD